MLTNGVERCYSPDGSVAPLTNAAPGSNVVPLLLIGVTILLFVGVIVGAWLDLRGVRTAGRLILLICATLLIFMPFLVMAATNPINGIAFAYVWPLTLLALVAGVLACVRRDTPRAAASPALG